MEVTATEELIKSQQSCREEKKKGKAPQGIEGTQYERTPHRNEGCEEEWEKEFYKKVQF